MKYPIGTMSIGDILGRGFQLLFARFGTFYPLMLIAVSPTLVLQLGLSDFLVGGLSALAFLFPMFLLQLVLQLVGTGAVIRVIMQDYLDRPVSLGESIRFALRRFPALLGTSLLAGLIITLGFFACVLPAIYFGLIYSMTSQTVIVENLAGMDALQRSKRLTDGHLGRVFGLLFLVGLLAGGASGVIGGVLGTALPYQEIIQTHGTFPTVRISSHTNYAISVTVTTLVQAFFQAYTAICTTLLYFDLRNRKEAFDLELEYEKLSAWTEHFRPQSQPASSDIQRPDDAIQTAGPGAPPVNPGIRPARPDDLPPTGPTPAP
jgi:hypothetical protein